MDAPLDLDAVAVAEVAGLLEVAEKPAAVGGGVDTGLAHVDAGEAAVMLHGWRG
jgi:hypothetical protein